MSSKARVECRQTTFLLTTNAADPQIFNYWRQHGNTILQSSLKPLALAQCLRPLDGQIRTALAGCLGVRGRPRPHGLALNIDACSAPQMRAHTHAPTHTHAHIF
jgi:hypothetical protein